MRRGGGGAGSIGIGWVSCRGVRCCVLEAWCAEMARARGLVVVVVWIG